jgi:MoaA/NifB/PqqE/SkfB family radical SAM enzyme
MIEDLKQIGFYTLSNERAKNSSPTSQMKRCEMIITEYCNFNCPYCRKLSPWIYGDRRIKELSFEEITRNIDYWCEQGALENIRFSGGEPSLHKRICDIIAYAKSKGIKRIAISTNGSNKLELYEELVKLGCNDFSISLDACCATDGDVMAGGIKGAFDKVVANIKALSKLTYVTVGVVLTPETVHKIVDIINYADSLGVADIRIISAAQWNGPLKELEKVPKEVLERHPILRYRIMHFLEGINVRGMKETDSPHCGLIMDDSIIAGDYHFPCVIYMRERGAAIGKVSPTMREERVKWYKEHNCFEDPICRNNCLDICIDYNNKYEEFHRKI